MGIKNFQQLLESDPVLSKAGVATVDLVRTAWTSNGGKVASTPNRMALVMDGEHCLDRLYGGYYSDWSCGGQWNNMLEFLSILFSSLQQANIHIATFLNGSLEQSRFQEWVQHQLKVKQNVKNVLRHLDKRGTPPPKVWWIPPTGIRSVIRLSLRHLNLTVMSSVQCHRLEVISFLRENGYHGLLADDSEYCIFDPPRYFSAHKIKLTLKMTVETQEIVMDEIAKSFDLNPNRFSLTAALLGNTMLTESDLSSFHKRLIPEMETNKVAPEAVIRAVINYIRSLVNIEDVEALGGEIFGSSSDPRVVKLRQVVDFYNSGTEDGYKKFRTSGGSKKTVMDMASDNIEVNTESKALYDNLVKAKKISSIAIKETEETIDQLASLTLDQEEEAKDDIKDTAKDSEEAVAAVAGNSVRASEQGKYPTNVNGVSEQMTKPGDIKSQIPTVNNEVVKTAGERHRQAYMSPHLYHLLIKGEISLPALLEDGDGGQLGFGIHNVFRELRRRVYGILFNQHHVEFVRKRYEEEVTVARKKIEEVVKKLSKVKTDAVVMKNNEPRSEREVLNEKLAAANKNLEQLMKASPVDEETVVREWVPYNRYVEPQSVSPVSLSWPVPTVQRLWFAPGMEDKQKRLRSFLSCMSSDSPLILETTHVPQHLLLMATVLRYIMCQTNILQKPELDAFLVTALSPELLETEYLTKMKLDLVTSRGVQLAALFMQGVEMALLANDACGAPVPFLMCCPWLFFDGKLFHSKLRRAVSAQNLLEMCEHRMDIVVKVERMRQAILEGLLPEFTNQQQHMMNMNINQRMMNMNLGGQRMMNNPNMSNMMGISQQMFQNRMRYGGQGVARGGQLVVAGSVVGQWGANFGGVGHQLVTGQRVRGSRGGKGKKNEKQKEQEEDDVKVVLVKKKSVDEEIVTK